MNSAADTLWTVRQIHYEQCGRYIMNSATDYIMNSAADTLWTVRQITLWTAPQINYEQCGRYIMNSAILYWLELNCRRARKKTHMRSTPSLRSFPNVAFQTVPVFVWLTMALVSSFEGRSSSASSFHASLLQAIDGVLSLALWPQVVSQAQQRWISEWTGLFYNRSGWDSGSFNIQPSLTIESRWGTQVACSQHAIKYEHDEGQKWIWWYYFKNVTNVFSVYALIIALMRSTPSQIMQQQQQNSKWR